MAIGLSVNGLFCSTGGLSSWRRRPSRYYHETYKQLLRKIVAGKILHVDETEVHVKGIGKAANFKKDVALIV